jgi:hypothetical protein
MSQVEHALAHLKQVHSDQINRQSARRLLHGGLRLVPEPFVSRHLQKFVPRPRQPEHVPIAPPILVVLKVTASVRIAGQHLFALLEIRLEKTCLAQQFNMVSYLLRREAIDFWIAINPRLLMTFNDQ